MMRKKCFCRMKKIEVVIKPCYNINNLRGCNGLDGDG